MITKEITVGSVFTRNITTDETKEYKKKGYENIVVDIEEKYKQRWIIDSQEHRHLISQIEVK